LVLPNRRVPSVFIDTSFRNYGWMQKRPVWVQSQLKNPGMRLRIIKITIVTSTKIKKYSTKPCPLFLIGLNMPPPY
jgi:hypothetical protein